MTGTALKQDPERISDDRAQFCPACGRPKPDTIEIPPGDATGGYGDRRYILSQLLKLFALCQERNIYLPDLYREAERIADPEPG